MFYFPSPKTTDLKERRVQRTLEMIPGILTWITLIGMLVASFLLPIWIAVFIIMFDIYWIYRTIFITYYSIVAYNKLQNGKMIDWWERCQNIVHPKEYAQTIYDRMAQLKLSLRKNKMTFTERRTLRREIARLAEYKREVQYIATEKIDVLDWRKIVHVVLLPTANEPADVIEPAIQAVADSNFPNQQIVILLATEERENEQNRLEKVNYLQDKFKGVFKDFLVTTHEVQDNEMKCKASNATYAAKKLMVYLDERDIDYKRVIFSNFDCDSVCHPQYFAALTHAYITDPKRLQRSYQPLPMYHNNIWDTNAFVRVIVTGSSFWHMFQSTRVQMVTFSSHSEPFDTLVKVNFWPLDMISEDSII
ncbi:MAG: FUSC family protein, partial [Candidatus Moranbacteria bacterium]|nr:FUSC family protein [Candidatus Moranbacteria bacterium]